MKNGLVIEYENKYWYRDGLVHREDGPAIEYKDGTKHWYRNGKYHREDGPAVENANGDLWWYKDGKLHRKDGPAVEHANGDKYWLRDGERYREDDLPHYEGWSKMWFYKNKWYDSFEEYVLAKVMK